jgi:hypothetical protein
LGIADLTVAHSESIEILTRKWQQKMMKVDFQTKVFFILNQCRMLCFKIIRRENSLHVTGCIGVEQIPKNVPNI